MSKAYYVYVDWTLEETSRAFYVGEGSGRRFKVVRRNRFHDNIAAKHGMRREIVAWFDTKREALVEETRLIMHYRTHFYIHEWGANFQLLGSEGTYGKIQSPESNAKRSETLRGRPKDPFTEEHRANMRVAFAHRPPFTDETRAKMSVVRKGVKKSEAYSRNRRLANQLRREAKLQAETAIAAASTSSQSEVKQ